MLNAAAPGDNLSARAASRGANMQVVRSEEHSLHFPQGELFGGELVTLFERPG